ncbi:hypothetical protein H0H93_005939, partial [Arthromyces matolae]
MNEPRPPPVPCPFSSFLSSLAFTVDLSEDPNDMFITKAYSRTSINPSSMAQTIPPEEVAEIDVVDVTDPEHPAYCFILVHGSPPQRTNLTPKSANDYLVACYPSGFNAETERITDIISALERERVVHLEILAQVLPTLYPEAQPQDMIQSLEPPSEKKTIPNLSDLVLRPAITHALENDDTEGIEQLLWIPGKAEGVMDVLKTFDVLSESGMNLLAKAINQLNQDRVDLSEIPLSASQVVSLTSQLHENVQFLDLSHNHLLTLDTICTILIALPILKRLTLIDTSITDEDILSLLKNPSLFCNHLEALIHPFLLSNPEYDEDREDARLPNGFGLAIARSQGWSHVTAASLPIFTPSLVVQSLTDYMRMYLILPRSERKEGAVQAALSTAVRTHGQTWATSTVSTVACDSFYGMINGEGWFFALNESTQRYAFLQAEPGNLAYGFELESFKKDAHLVKDVLDLHGFLLRMSREGRPAPPPNAVNTLRDILGTLPADQE